MTFQSSHRRTRTTHATRSTETAKHGMLAFEIHRVGVVVPGVVVVDDDDTVAVSKSVSSGFRNDTCRDETKDVIHDAGDDDGDDDGWWCVALVSVASTGESETATASRRGGVDVQV
jgi:hypothetical protein